MGDMISGYKVSVENFEDKDNMEDAGMDKR
jgi:hypothetical protein